MKKLIKSLGLTSSDIADENARQRKQFPIFHRELDEFQSKRGLPKSIRRHEVKERNRARSNSQAIKNKSN